MEIWPFEAESASDGWDRTFQKITPRLTNYYKVDWKEKELSALTAAWLIFYTMGRRMALAIARDIADRRPWARATIQLSKIRGANGKIGTSRGRKSPAQEYMGAPRECRRKRHTRVKQESLNPYIQEGKKGIRGLMSVFRKIPAVTDFSER